jgi:anti-sigma regulatory factor (Ser/Thr protein kinase)
MQPSGVFSGDAVLRRQANDGSWYFIMADAMGHGLAPAVSLMPLMQHFQMLVGKTLPLANIVFELNGMLNILLPPDRFVAALLMRIDPWRSELEVWNAGMPTLQCLNAEGQLIAQAASTHMALGVLSNHQISAAPQVMSLKEIAHLVMFSDGLTETMLPSGQMLDSALVASYLQLTGSDPFCRLRQLFGGLSAEDDVSVCLIHCRDLLQSQPQVPEFLTDQTSSFSTQFHFSGGALRALDTPQQAIDLLRAQGLPQAFLQRVFTVLTELFVNALEHGVLQLDSQLKDQPDGFCQFYEEKERRLQLLTEQHFIEFILSWSSADSALTAKCTDSGKGFIPILAATEDQNISYGRGLRLIQQLTRQFHIEPPGNCFTVVMSPEVRTTNNQ